MLCAFPIRKNIGLGNYPCGQCMPCRVNSQRKKTTRLILEAREHPVTSFITLTYDEENLPRRVCHGMLVGVLHAPDLTKFLRKLRDAVGKYRYMAVGEYGDESQRPHYHAILFGVDPMVLDHEEMLRKLWGQGHVTIGENTVKRMKYVAHYTTKKMTKEKDDRLVGRPPEFMRCSRRPGLGYTAVKRLSDYFYTDAGSRVLAETGDVVNTIRHEGKSWPLDYYMLTKLREELGIPKLAKDRKGIDPPEPVSEEDQENAVKHHAKLQRRKHGTL